MKATSIALGLAVFFAPLSAVQAQNAREVGGAARDIVSTPLRDLNVTGEEADAYLAAIRSPYEEISPRNCSNIGRHVQQLDAALGPDADSPQEDSETLMTTVTDLASSAVGSVIPFRGLVREISGANDRDEYLLEIRLRGLARRAYLKGLGDALGCDTPAAPTGYIPPIGDQDEDEQED